MTLNRSSKIQNKKLLCLIWCIEHKLVTVGCRTVLAVNTRTRCLVCPRIHITYAIKSHFDFSQRWAERNSVSLGLMHGRDTWWEWLSSSSQTIMTARLLTEAHRDQQSLDNHLLILIRHGRVVHHATNGFTPNYARSLVSALQLRFV